MCGDGVRSIVDRCLETIDVCIWRMFVLCLFYYSVGLCGNVCCVAAIVKESVF